MELGDRIRELRTKHRLSQGDLGRAIKSATSTISEVERGERKPRTELLLKIADYFDVSVDFLLGRISEESTREFAELKNEMDTLRKDYGNLRADLKGLLTNVSYKPLPLGPIPLELLMEIPDTIDEDTQARLEAEFDLRIRTSRLEEKHVNEIFRYILIMKRMKERDGLPEKNG